MTIVREEGDADNGHPWNAAIPSEAACQRRGSFRDSAFVTIDARVTAIIYLRDH